MYASKSICLMLAAGSLLLMANESFSAPRVRSGFEASEALTGAVRYRNLSSTSTSGGPKEIWLGVSPLVESSSATGDVSWYTTGRCVQFSYDGSGTLTTKVAPIATPCVFTSPLTTVTKAGLSLGNNLNYLKIQIKKSSLSNSIALNDVVLNSYSIGDFLNDPDPDGPAIFNWSVDQIDLTSGFTLTGTVVLDGLNGGGDSNLVELSVGYVAPSDVEGPVTSNVAVNPKPVLLNGEGTVTANIDDSATGNNKVVSAQYYLDGGADTAMSSQDGSFDAPSEDVAAAFTASQLGTHEVCVYGTDSAGNNGDPLCEQFMVTYKFDGFYSPIDNSLLNIAKAGQAVPAKWRLTDAVGQPISDPASFVGLFSYPISCTDLQGDIADAVEEYSAGASGLQYNGDGYWQYNWKSDKSYANTCRAMYIEFDSGALSPIVKFQFKK